jgi:hypothetical protein
MSLSLTQIDHECWSRDQEEGKTNEYYGLSLDHKFWWYDYCHSLSLDFRTNKFIVVIGGGQSIENIFHGTFVDVEDEKHLKLKYLQCENIYEEESEKMSDLREAVLVDVTYEIIEANYEGFNGYNKQIAKYCIDFSEDPFYYGVRRATLFNMIDGSRAERDTEIFWTDLKHIDCDTIYERWTRDKEYTSYDKLTTEFETICKNANKPIVKLVQQSDNNLLHILNKLRKLKIKKSTLLLQTSLSLR